MKKNSLVSKILTVVMVIECLFIVVTFLLFCEEYDFGHTWFYEEDSFVYNIKEETYGEMVLSYYNNDLGGCKETRGLRECYGVAKYYEAAFWKNAYDIVGDAQWSAHYAEKMEEAYGEMGDYKFLESTIQEKLNMQ